MKKGAGLEQMMCHKKFRGGRTNKDQNLTNKGMIGEKGVSNLGRGFGKEARGRGDKNTDVYGTARRKRRGIPGI